MQVILKKDMDKLGYADDIIDVKPGYANNYLIPNGLAMVATKSAVKEHAERVKQRAHKEAKVVENATKLVAKLAETKLTIPMKAEDGRIFGSVTTVMLSEALAKKGVEIDRRDITIDTTGMSTIGDYEASARIYREIYGTIPFAIVPEE